MPTWQLWVFQIPALSFSSLLCKITSFYQACFFTFLSNLETLLREECSNNNKTKGMKLWSIPWDGNIKLPLLRQLACQVGEVYRSEFWTFIKHRILWFKSAIVFKNFYIVVGWSKGKEVEMKICSKSLRKKIRLEGMKNFDIEYEDWRRRPRVILANPRHPPSLA